LLDTFELNKDTVKELRDGLDKMMQKFGQENGITIKLGTVRYSSDNFKIPIEGMIDRGDGLTFEAGEFLKHYEKYGLVASDLGREFITESGKCMKITGLKTRNRKYPILAKEVDTDKNFKYSAEFVRFSLDSRDVMGVD